MTQTPMPRWAIDANIGTFAVFTLDYGEHLTAEIRGFDKDTGEVIVDPITSDRTPRTSFRSRAISVRRVISFEPRPRAELPWPYSDPCRGKSFSGARHALMAALVIGLVAGSVALSMLFDSPYGLPIVSVVVYTLLVLFITFARTGGASGFSKWGGLEPYLFTCPAVRPQLPRLLRRHAGFLLGLIVFEGFALAIRPSLPSWWNTGNDALGGRPFTLVWSGAFLVLAFAEVWSNRSILSRAHEEFSTS